MSINITELITTFMSNLQQWLPTITTIASFLFCIIYGVGRVKRAANDLKSDKTVREIRDEQSATREEMVNIRTQEKEILRLVRRALDENHKIKRGTVNEADDDDREEDDEGGEGIA